MFFSSVTKKIQKLHSSVTSFEAYLCNKFVDEMFVNVFIATQKTHFSSSGKIILKYVKYIQTSHRYHRYDQKRKNMKIN